MAPSGSDEEGFYTQQHLENNTFDETTGAPLFQQQGNGAAAGHFVDGEQVRVLVVEIKDVRISDYKGNVRDWAVVPEGTMVNGSG